MIWKKKKTCFPMTHPYLLLFTNTHNISFPFHSLPFSLSVSLCAKKMTFFSKKINKFNQTQNKTIQNTHIHRRTQCLRSPKKNTRNGNKQKKRKRCMHKTRSILWLLLLLLSCKSTASAALINLFNLI